MSTVQKWNMDVEWQNDSSYIVRCIEESFAKSSGGNPMITLKFEVAAPETMEVKGETYNIAGVPISYWAVTQVRDGEEVNTEKSEGCLKRLTALYNAFGLDSSDINVENPALGFKGKTVYALITNDQKEKRKSPTAEQLKKGMRFGDVMVNPITKQPLITNYPKISDIFGLAEVTSGTAAY